LELRPARSRRRGMHRPSAACSACATRSRRRCRAASSASGAARRPWRVSSPR